jgi:hypothetical protein
MFFRIDLTHTQPISFVRSPSINVQGTNRDCRTDNGVIPCAVTKSWKDLRSAQRDQPREQTNEPVLSTISRERTVGSTLFD